MAKIRKLYNDAVAEDSGRLDLWATELKDNADVIDALLNEDTTIPELKEYVDYNAAAAWDKMEDSLPEEYNNVELKDYRDYDAPKAHAKVDRKLFEQTGKTRTLAPLFRIAAAGAVLLLATFGVMNFLNNGSSTLTIELASAKQAYNLPDGSIITLDEGSEIAYNKADFGKSRVVQFDGRGYFDISKQDGQNFTIESEGLEVEVLGTSFEIDMENEIKEVCVYEGKVRVAVGGKEVFLIAGEAATIQNNKLDKQTISADLPSWFTGVLPFDNVKIKDAIAQIEDHYNITVNVDGKSSDLDCGIHTEFRNESLDSILEELKTLFGGSYKNNGDQVNITGLQCTK